MRFQPIRVCSRTRRSQLVALYHKWNLDRRLSQVQAHIERRFAMPWSRPAARMAEFVAAVRAIWASWQTGERLAFRGEFYRHTLMTDFFNPGPNPYGYPPIVLAAVGERMTDRRSGRDPAGPRIDEWAVVATEPTVIGSSSAGQPIPVRATNSTPTPSGS